MRGRKGERRKTYLYEKGGKATWTTYKGTEKKKEAEGAENGGEGNSPQTQGEYTKHWVKVTRRR